MVHWGYGQEPNSSTSKYVSLVVSNAAKQGPAVCRSVESADIPIRQNGPTSVAKLLPRFLLLCPVLTLASYEHMQSFEDIFVMLIGVLMVELHLG